MAQCQRYRINAPFVTSEVIDGEVVIIHLDSGNYYSTQGVGERIWSQLLDGEATDGIAVDLVRRYACDEATAGRAVERLVGELVAEGLMVPSAAEGPGSGSRPGPGRVAEPVAVATEFAEPVLTKYTDMQNLLMVDPIHEVTDEGWPMRANAQSQRDNGRGET